MCVWTAQDDDDDDGNDCECMLGDCAAAAVGGFPHPTPVGGRHKLSAYYPDLNVRLDNFMRFLFRFAMHAVPWPLVGGKALPHPKWPTRMSDTE